MIEDQEIVALYRNTARELPDERLDRAVLGKAAIAAWRRRHHAMLLAASFAGLAVVVGMASMLAVKPTRPVPDTSQFGMTAGRPQPYAIDAHLDAGEPGLDANPVRMAASPARRN